jgi:hypothetical protein
VNAPFYAFLRRERGAAFAARAVPWHLVYFACSGAGAALGLAQHVSEALAGRAASPAVEQHA